MPPQPKSAQRPRESAPIFVLAAPHTHGALLGAMLGQHPDAFGLPELNLFVTDTLEGLWSEMADSRQTQTHGLLRAVAYLFGGEQSIDAIAMARRWLARRMHLPTSRVFNEIRAKIAPFRLVEKSRLNVSDAENLARINETCPDAYYVHLVRHPRSFCAAALAETSELRHFAREMREPDTNGRGEADPQLLWLAVERRIGGFLEGIPAERQVHVRVEELFTSPQRQLRSLAAAVRLSAGRAALAGMMHPERSPFAGFGPVGANLGDELTFLQTPTFPVPLTTASGLDGPLPWRRDHGSFRDDVVERAQALGYA